MEGIRNRWAGLSSNGRRGVVGAGIGVVAIAVVAGLIAAGGSEAAAPPTTTTAVTTTTTAPVTTTTAAPKGPVAPLTGLPAADPALLTRPPLAVKVDNLDAATESAVPQTGLLRADVVFEEIVEGNITRLVGVFHSQLPGRVGPVRSARTTDVQLLPQLGRPLLAWSGGNEGVTGAVSASPSIIDVGVNVVPGSYHRDRSRRAPHNLYVTGDELYGHVPADLPPPTQLFQYRDGEQPPPATARAARGLDIVWGGGVAVAPVGWRWDAAQGLWLRDQRGRPHLDESGTQLSAHNVLVLVTEYGQSAADARSPEAITVGSGELFAYIGGRVIHGRWDRPDQSRPATLVDDTGAPVLLTPGRTWVELARPGTTTTAFA